MVDEIFDRHYQAGRDQLNAGIGRGLAQLGRLMGDSFKVLHRIEWNAPWNAQSKGTQCH